MGAAIILTHFSPRNHTGIKQFGHDFPLKKKIQILTISFYCEQIRNFRKFFLMPTFFILEFIHTWHL